MKKCSKCGDEKPLEEFHRNAKGPSGRNSRCRECVNLSKRESYKSTPATRSRVAVSKARARDLARVLIWEHKLSNPCVDCGEGDPVVLHFDHVGDDKTAGISVLAQKGASLKRIQEEMDKCVVRCANCHMRITALRGNFWRPESVSDPWSEPENVTEIS